MIPKKDAEALLDEYVVALMRDDESDFGTLRDRVLARSDLVLRGAENVAQKGRRMVAEGRIEIVRVDVDGGLVVARCRGDSGEIYDLGFDPRRREWRCTCEARGRCSHLAALQLVTVRSTKRRST